jgi:hypothetical protein
LVGSNTIEDLGDAWSGTAPTPGLGNVAVSNYHTYTPLYDPTSFEQIYSWDALNQANAVGVNTVDCITAKPGTSPIARPNGSGNGLKAISDAIEGVAWSAASATTCAPQIPTGFIDIGRSSSPPSGANCVFPGPCVAWIDIAHDAVSYAYQIQSGATATQAQVQGLTNAQLTSLYSNTTTGTFTDAATGVTYLACLPQLGSGTEKFFIGTLAGGAGVAQATAEAAATAAKCVNFEENGANTFQSVANGAFTSDAADTPAPTVAITPFSVGSFVSQANGVAFDRSKTGIGSGPPAGVGLGCIDGSAPTSLCGTTLIPYTGTAPNLAPLPSFEASQYGRDLYLETNNLALNGRVGQFSSPLRGILGFLGTNYTANTGGPITPGSSQAPTGKVGAVCLATATNPYQSTDLTSFGFTPPSIHHCGDEFLTVPTPGAGT